MAVRPTPALPPLAPGNTATTLGSNARFLAQRDGAVVHQSAADLLAENLPADTALLDAVAGDVVDAAQTLLYPPDGGPPKSAALSLLKPYFGAAATAATAPATAAAPPALLDTDGLIADFDPGRLGTVFTSADFLGAAASVGGPVGLLDAGAGGKIAQEGDVNVQPTLVEAGGRRAVRFDGGRFTRLTSLAGPDWMAVQASDFTVALAVRTPAAMTGNGNSAFSLFRDNDTTAGIFVIGGFSSARRIFCYRSAGAGELYLEYDQDTLPGTPYSIVVRSTFGSPRLSLNVNGRDMPDAVGTGPYTPGGAWDRCQLGAERFAGANFTGDMFRARLYGQSKDVISVARLRRFFLDAYGA